MESSNLARAEAEALDEFVDGMISAVSHELGTPLAAIRGYAELLCARDDEATRREAPRRIAEAAERLSSVVDEIVTAAAIESGAVTLDPVPLDLEAVVDDAIARVARSDGDHSFSRHCASGARWPVVLADREQLHRVLSSLVSNACTSSPHGGEIAIRAGESGDWALVSVRDEGVGLTEMERARVFERPTRLDAAEARARGATRLGLYVTRWLVELHGGSIWVESEPGAGSTFTFTIPVADAEDRT